MEEILAKIMEYAAPVCQALGALVVFATSIVFITKSKSDDAIANNWAGKFFKAMAWLPTIGINPRTKKLEEAYNELKRKE